MQEVNFVVPTATDNSGMIARTEVRPEGFHMPMHVFENTMIEYLAYDFDGNVAICQINITVMDDTPPQLTCPQSFVIELVEPQDSYQVSYFVSFYLLCLFCLFCFVLFCFSMIKTFVLKQS